MVAERECVFSVFLCVGIIEGSPGRTRQVAIDTTGKRDFVVVIFAHLSHHNMDSSNNCLIIFVVAYLSRFRASAFCPDCCRTRSHTHTLLLFGRRTAHSAAAPLHVVFPRPRTTDFHCLAVELLISYRARFVLYLQGKLVGRHDQQEDHEAVPRRVG